MSHIIVRLLTLGTFALSLGACSKTQSAAEVRPSGQVSRTSPAQTATSSACAGLPDIAGLCLGMPQDAAIKALDVLSAGNGVNTNRGTIQYGTFVSQPMTFSSTPATGSAQGEVNVHVVYGVPKGGVLYIYRQKSFDAQSATTFANLTASFEAKFGKPAAVVTNKNETQTIETIVWTHGSSVDATATSAQTFGSDAELCMQGLYAGAAGQGFLSDYFWGSMSTPPDPLYERCGTWTVVTINSLAQDPNLAGTYEIKSGDLTALSRAYADVLTMMKAGAAKADAAAASRSPNL